MKERVGGGLVKLGKILQSKLKLFSKSLSKIAEKGIPLSYHSQLKMDEVSKFFLFQG